MADEPVQQTGQNESMKTELWHSDNLVRSGHQYVATSLDGSASAHFGDVYHSHNYTQAVRGKLSMHLPLPGQQVKIADSIRVSPFTTIADGVSSTECSCESKTDSIDFS